MAERDGQGVGEQDALLRSLKGYPLFAPFHLALRSASAAGEPPCGLDGGEAPCRTSCRPVVASAVGEALRAERPVVFPCPEGLLHFAVPGRKGLCLLGGGGLDPAREAAGPPATQPTNRMKAMPRVTPQEIERVAQEGHHLLPSLFAEDLYALAREKMSRQIDVLAEVSRGIDQAGSVPEAVALFCDAAVVLFDLPGVAVYLAAGGRGFALAHALGHADSPSGADERVAAFLRDQPAAKAAPLDGGPFPGRSWGVPLRSGAEALGLAILRTADPHPQELQVVELLAGRLAMKLDCLGREERLQQENAHARKLLSLVSALSLKQNREELFSALVEMAADLLQASCASLMLVEDGRVLRVAASTGLPPALARGMSAPVGTGIAGRVARSGLPLLVGDIERDSRVGIPNRPRFRTKSFLSVPLLTGGRPTGVLNVADKEDGGVFTEGDLNLLTAFATHAALVIDRVESAERAERYAELSVTDPLTRLYNRRFLEDRLEGELSRSRRQGLVFTVMLVDLDNFKLYNDRCGHLAGDDALVRSARLLRESAREMDVVTRYGGEEFCLILPGTGKKESLFVAERIRRAIERESFPGEEQLPGERLTASLGLASFPADGRSAEELIAAADVALYRAKDEGRNRCVLAEPSLKCEALLA